MSKRVDENLQTTGADHRHPIDPLSTAEIVEAARILRDTHDLGPGMRFETIELIEPPVDAQRAQVGKQTCPRRAFAAAYDTKSGRLFEAVVALDTAKVESWAERPGAKALYIFPFKALEQDQKSAFDKMAATFPEDQRPRCAIYDGDTPATLRRKIKADPPQVLITNPDMLHLGILAHHGNWAGFLAGLETVVVDELHVYRGIFGTHMHHIMQRLRRLCAHYGSRPAFVAAFSSQ